MEDVVAGSELVFPVRRLARDGLAAWQQVVERGFEGYVAKDEVSTYEGGATRRWLKVNQKSWTIGDERWTRRISVVERRRSTSPLAGSSNNSTSGVWLDKRGAPGDVGWRGARQASQAAADSCPTRSHCRGV